MATENFTTYTEEDPNSRITKTASRVTWTGLDRNETAYVAKDKTADFFDGDFTHLLTVYITATVSGSYVHAWALTNTIDGLFTIYDADGDYLGITIIGTATGRSIGVIDCDAGSLHSSANSWVDAELNTNYYLKIVRDESVGDYGTLYCYIYSDAARTTLLATPSVALHTSTKDFRYIYAVSSMNSSATPYPGSGYSENLTIISGATTAPTVTTQAMSSIVSTTATGNGNVTSLGNPSATQHGHCWNTTGTPTTSDDKTENGAAATTGAFTSSLTGLTSTTLYYVRAYATNVAGTSYGQPVTFTAGAVGGEISGNYAVVETRFHYVDAYGTERYMEGTAIQ